MLPHVGIPFLFDSGLFHGSHFGVSETHSLTYKESRVTLLPSEPEMLRIEMRNERELLPALESLQVLGSILQHFCFFSGLCNSREAACNVALLQVLLVSFSVLVPSRSW